MARGSALEMEFKRGRFRLSLFSDPPEVRTPRPCFPSPPGLPQPRPPCPRPRARRGAETQLAASKPAIVDLKSQAQTIGTLLGPVPPQTLPDSVGMICLCPDKLQLASF